MWRLYLIPCSLVLIASGAIAIGTYASGSVDYAASCTFQVSRPLTSVGNSDDLSFERASAQQDVSEVTRGDIFTGPADAVGVDPADVAKHFAVAPIGETTIFNVALTDMNASRASDLANRLCDELVQRIAAKHSNEREVEVTQLQAQIATMLQSIVGIQKTPAAQISPADQSFLAAQQKAIAVDQQLLAQTLSLPADNVSVVTRSPHGVRFDTRNLARNLIVGGIAGVLACFLIVLFGEIATDLRRAAAGSRRREASLRAAAEPETPAAVPRGDAEASPSG